MDEERNSEYGTYEDMIDLLKDALPHGSGINGDWEFEQGYYAHRFICSNTYSAMDEGGGYCHNYDFSCIVDIGQSKPLIMRRLNFEGPELEGCGSGLQEYLEDTLWEYADRYKAKEAS